MRTAVTRVEDQTGGELGSEGRGGAVGKLRPGHYDRPPAQEVVIHGALLRYKLGTMWRLIQEDHT